MKQTFVFNFYNLYIPKGRPYINKELGIKVFPLKLAEDFEKNRRSSTSPFYRNGWKTAKCHIKAQEEDDARKYASWLEFLYSFAQSRSVFFLRCYLYKKKWRRISEYN